MSFSFCMLVGFADILRQIFFKLPDMTVAVGFFRLNSVNLIAVKTFVLQKQSLWTLNFSRSRRVSLSVPKKDSKTYEPVRIFSLNCCVFQRIFTCSVSFSPHLVSNCCQKFFFYCKKRSQIFSHFLCCFYAEFQFQNDEFPTSKYPKITSFCIVGFSYWQLHPLIVALWMSAFYV